MVEDHEGTVGRSRLSYLRPDKIVFVPSSRYARLEPDPSVFLFNNLILLDRVFEEGRVCGGPVRERTEFSETGNPRGVRKCERRIEGESGLLL